MLSQSCPTLFETSWTAAHHAPLWTEFSRQEYWSGVPFPTPGDLPNPLPFPSPGISTSQMSKLTFREAKWFCQDETDGKKQRWDLNNKQPGFKWQGVNNYVHRLTCSKSPTDMDPHLASSHNTIFLYSVFPLHSVYTSLMLNLAVRWFLFITYISLYLFSFPTSTSPLPQLKIIEGRSSYILFFRCLEHNTMMGRLQ